MDLLYAMHRKPLKSIPTTLESLNGGPTLCTISTGNIAAFTSLTQLEDDSGSTWGCHVYVCDIDTPWSCHKVASFVRQVSALEWDQQGRHLLIADCAGDVCFYGSKDYLLNDWMCLYKACFSGEHIIKAAFFHNGRKIISSEKKSDQSSSPEKFQYLRFAPSVRQFGGVAAEGAVIITATGMLGAVLLPIDIPQNPPKTLQIACESLGSTRGYITTADICYGKNVFLDGHFLIAVSSGNVSHAIQCYRVSVKRSFSLQDEQKPLLVTSQALPSFFLRESTIKDYHCTQIVQVRWASREDTDSLIVAVNGPLGRVGCVELWGLVERSLPVHNLLTKGPTSSHNNSDCFNTVLWQHQYSYHSTTAQIVSVTSSKVQIAGTVTGSLSTPSLPYIFVTLNDNSILCLYRDTLKQASSASLSQAWSLNEGIVIGSGTPPKQIKFSPMHGGQGSPGPALGSPICLQQPGAAISSCDASWLGGVLLVIDSTSHLYMYKLPQPALDTGSSIAVNHVTTLLEYSMVTGFDPLDIMMVLKPATIESIYERFTDSFLRQPVIWQQFYYTKWLSLRAALSRMTASGQIRASDLTSLLMLHSIATAFKSLLRPSELVSYEKGPAESLAAVISDQANPVIDIDKALMHIEAKEFTVEPSTVQSAQQLIQWAAEVALAAMARLPAAAATNVTHSYELFRDANALNTLRELLVVVRVWGLLRPNCLPVFTKSAENVDVLSLLYKLLTRLAQNGCEPDDALLDECSMLPSQVLIPQINESLPRTCILSPALYYQNLPLQLEFGIEPDMLKYTPDIPPLEGSITSESCMDSIRHLHLGIRPSAIKRCGRCGAAAARQALQRTTAIRAWDQRWLPACRCGGLWTVETNS